MIARNPKLQKTFMIAGWQAAASAAACLPKWVDGAATPPPGTADLEGGLVNTLNLKPNY
jgi:hypothetical protein